MSLSQVHFKVKETRITTFNDWNHYMWEKVYLTQFFANMEEVYDIYSRDPPGVDQGDFAVVWTNQIMYILYKDIISHRGKFDSTFFST